MLAQPPTVPPLADQAGSTNTGYRVDAAVSNDRSGVRVTAVDVAVAATFATCAASPGPAGPEAAGRVGWASSTRPSTSVAGTPGAAFPQSPIVGATPVNTARPRPSVALVVPPPSGHT